MHIVPSISPSSSEIMLRLLFVSKLGEVDTDTGQAGPLCINLAWPRHRVTSSANLNLLFGSVTCVYCPGHLEIKGLLVKVNVKGEWKCCKAENVANLLQTSVGQDHLPFPISTAFVFFSALWSPSTVSCFLLVLWAYTLVHLHTKVTSLFSWHQTLHAPLHYSLLCVFRVTRIINWVERLEIIVVGVAGGWHQQTCGL